MGSDESHRELRTASLTIPLSATEIRALRAAAERCNLPMAVRARAILMKTLTLNPVEL